MLRYSISEAMIRCLLVITQVPLKKGKFSENERLPIDMRQIIFYVEKLVIHSLSLSYQDSM